ncbi:hypothetical protein G3M53_81765 [Streptomyces sp. SID7982]|nr:hypothetical protein [Streptomyces sp. SID7982]
MQAATERQLRERLQEPEEQLRLVQQEFGCPIRRSGPMICVPPFNGAAATEATVRRIVPEARERGYRFVKVSELAEDRPEMACQAR